MKIKLSGPTRINKIKLSDRYWAQSIFYPLFKIMLNILSRNMKNLLIIHCSKFTSTKLKIESFFKLNQDAI